MQSYLWSYLVAFLVFLALDAIWLFTAGRTIYVSEIGALLRERPNFFAALFFYALYVAGLTYFVIVPGIGNANFLQAILNGAAFGLVAYATYDLTNYSTMKGFTLRIALIDMAWGTVLSGLVTAFTLMIRSRF
jgi:uncharacterized membrane protein